MVIKAADPRAIQDTLLCNFTPITNIIRVPIQSNSSINNPIPILPIVVITEKMRILILKYRNFYFYVKILTILVGYIFFLRNLTIMFVLTLIKFRPINLLVALFRTCVHTYNNLIPISNFLKIKLNNLLCTPKTAFDTATICHVYYFSYIPSIFKCTIGN